MSDESRLLHRLSRLSRLRLADRARAARSLSDACAAVSRGEAQLEALTSLLRDREANGPETPGALLARHRLTTLVAEQAGLAETRQTGLRREAEEARTALGIADTRARIVEERYEIARTTADERG